MKTDKSSSVCEAFIRLLKEEIELGDDAIVFIQKSLQKLISDLLSFPNDIIGKTCWYRKLYDHEFKEATIVEVKLLKDQQGKNKTLLLLQGGDKVLLDTVYFEFSTEAANS